MNKKGHFPKMIEIKHYHFLDLSNIERIKGLKPGFIYMGRTCLTNSRHVLKKKDIKEFCLIIQLLIDNGYVNSYLIPPCKFSLVSLDIKRNRAVNDDGSRALLSPDCKNDTFISPKEDITFRDMILFYFTSDYTKEQINDRIGKKICNLEGELPEMW
jgi:hypothetical protein